MYNIAIVGCGMMSSAWIEFTMKRSDCNIVALIDVNIDNANKKVQQNKLSAKTYTNLSTALEKESIQLVFDITPPEYHYDTVSTALSAGCNVFGEKPMSDSLESAYKLVDLSNRTNKEYFVMQNRRYISQINDFKRFLHSEKLGNIGQLSASFQLNPRFGGFREEMDSPLIADMAIHTFDAARYLLNKNPVSVYCKEFNPSWSWYKGNASAVCIFQMDDGSIFDYRGSWCTNGLNTSWESEWRATCSNGSAYWDGADKLIYDTGNVDIKITGLADDENTQETKVKDIAHANISFNSQHAGCLTEMFDALKSGVRPQTDCRDNIKSIEMVYKAIESAKTNTVISF